jgi:hypothetical protein
MTCKKLNKIGDVVTHPNLAGEWAVVDIYGRGSTEAQTIVLMKLTKGAIDWSFPQIREYQSVKVDTLFNNHKVIRNLIKEKK